MRLARFASTFAVALFLVPFGCSSSSGGGAPDTAGQDTGVFTTRPDDDTGVAPDAIDDATDGATDATTDATDDATDAFDASDAAVDG